MSLNMLFRRYAPLLIYAGCSFVCVMHHEAWRDELQAWIIARELSPAEIIYQMRYEGHFALWSLLLYPLAHCGAGLLSMNVVAWVSMLFAGWLLLRYSTLPRWVQLCTLFSFPCLYYFPVVARCYALIPPILFGLAVLYPLLRDGKLRIHIYYCLLLGLLANTHVYIEGFVAVLWCIYLYDHIFAPRALGWRLCAPATTLLLVLCAALQVLPALSLKLPAASSPYSISRTLEELSYTITPQEWGASNWVHVALLTVLLAAALIRSRRGFNARLPLILLFGIGWQVYFSTNIYGMSLQRSYLTFFILLFLAWINKSKPLSLLNITVSALTILSLTHLTEVSRDLRGNYTNAKDIAMQLPVDTPVYTDNMTKVINAFRPQLLPLSLQTGKPHQIYSPHILRRTEPFEDKLTTSPNGVIYYVRAHIGLPRFAKFIDNPQGNYKIQQILPKPGDTPPVREVFYLYRISKTNAAHNNTRNTDTPARSM